MRGLTHYDAYKQELDVLGKGAKKLGRDKWRAINKCSPYIDADGVMRMKGRIDVANYVDRDTMRPIMLPKEHRITYLLLQSYHRRYHHHNHETVVNEIRQIYYIPHLRTILKKTIRSCQKCKNAAVTPQPPEMADLPKARLNAFSRPFTCVGVDYFGPMKVKVGRRQEKRWGVLFTCLTVRAIHLEIAHSLTTDSCIMCIRNFIARRGIPEEIHSDNGTNLKGADRELREELRNVDQVRIQEKFTSPVTEWIFNPPVAPHMGGSWERLVGSVKKILLETMPTRTPSDELLRCVLTVAENVVNSRPLTYIPVEAENTEALTPNHFLIGSSNGTQPPGEFTNRDLIGRKDWRIAQTLINSFWKRWVREYLPTLTRRSKWHQKAKPIQKGDIVIIVDENSPRNCWPKGVIVDTKPGKDGQVRQATVRTSEGNIYTRPAVKLAVLDVGQV